MAMFKGYQGGEITPATTDLVSGMNQAAQMRFAGIMSASKALAEGLSEYYKNSALERERKSIAATEQAVNNVPQTTDKEVSIKMDLPQWGDGSRIADLRGKFFAAHKAKQEDAEKRAASVGRSIKQFDTPEGAWAKALPLYAASVASTPDSMLTKAERESVLKGLAAEQERLASFASDKAFESSVDYLFGPEPTDIESLLSSGDAYFKADKTLGEVKRAPKVQAPTDSPSLALGEFQTLADLRKQGPIPMSPYEGEKTPEMQALFDKTQQVVDAATKSNFVPSNLPGTSAIGKLTAKLDKNGEPMEIGQLTSNPYWKKLGTADAVAKAFSEEKRIETAVDMLVEYRSMLAEQGLSESEQGIRVAELAAKAQGIDVPAIKKALQKSMGTAAPEAYRTALLAKIELAMEAAAESNRKGHESDIVSAAKGAGKWTAVSGAAIGTGYGIYKGYQALDKAWVDREIKARRLGYRKLRSTKVETVTGKHGGVRDFDVPETDEDVTKRVRAESLDEELRSKGIKRSDYDKFDDVRKAEIAADAEVRAQKRILARGGMKGIEAWLRTNKFGRGLSFAGKLASVLTATGTVATGIYQAGQETALKVSPTYAFEEDFAHLFGEKQGYKSVKAEADAVVGRATDALRARQDAEVLARGLDISYTSGGEAPKTPFSVRGKSIEQVGIGLIPAKKEPSKYSNEIVNWVKNVYPDANVDTVLHTLRGLQPQYSFITDPESGARFVQTKDEKGNVKMQQIQEIKGGEDKGRIVGQAIQGDDGVTRAFIPRKMGAISVMGRFDSSIPQKEQGDAVVSLETLGRAAQTLHELKILYTTYGEEVTGAAAGAMDSRANELIARLRKELGDVGALTQYDVERLVAQIPNPSGWKTLWTIDKEGTKFVNLSNYINGSIENITGRYGLSYQSTPVDYTPEEIIKGVTSKSGTGSRGDLTSDMRIILNTSQNK